MFVFGLLNVENTRKLMKMQYNIFFFLLREILRIIWKLIVPWEDFDKKCLSTFELTKYTHANLIFPVFLLCKTISCFPIENFLLVLTNIKKSVKK